MAKANANPEPEAFPAEQALPIGAVLSGDQFTITEHLGAGGFGKTYRAEDNVLGRTVVIKEWFPEDFCIRRGKSVVARSKSKEEPLLSIVEMFMREARSLAKLRHPNIVGVHRAFEENETAYMALDLIDGSDLQSILKSQTQSLSPKRVRDILLQLLDAIGKVHENDLLHRDISPDNIILEKSGAPVLIDFGAARADASRRTRAMSSILVVKDGYSPHELYVAGSEQTPSSDLYALGSTFYHVLSGEAPPHSQHRMLEVAGGKSDPCAPLAGRIDGYDEDFLSAIDQAMAIRPENRLQSADRWKAMISDVATDAESMVPLTPRLSSVDVDLELERSLAKLVEETNAEVKITQLIPAAPQATPPPSEKVRILSWVDEFNRESEEPASNGYFFDSERGWTGVSQTVSQVSSSGSSDITAPPATNSPTNWIGRAFEKLDQERIERERDLERFLADAARPDVPMDGSALRPGTATQDEDLAPPAPVSGTDLRTIRVVAGLFFCASVFWLSVLN